MRRAEKNHRGAGAAGEERPRSIRIQSGCLQIQENYAMDAVQRDLNMLLTPDQIDNGGLFIYTTLDPAVQKAASTRSRRS